MAQHENVVVELVDNVEDFTGIFHCVAESFGRQIRDGLWITLYPDFDSPEIRKKGALEFQERWEHIQTNKDGKPNTVFLKATLPDPEDPSKRRIVGMAIWQQCSFVEGYGDVPKDNIGKGVDHLDPASARFVNQAFRSLWKRRIEVTKEKEHSDPPAIFVLDMCGVDPAFQRRGISQKLVQWGLDEAKRRGNLECTTEASSMGRGAYTKLGFKAEGEEDIVFEVDDEFKDWRVPPNIFLRTGIKVGA